jgi:hypothetical protein
MERKTCMNPKAPNPPPTLPSRRVASWIGALALLVALPAAAQVVEPPFDSDYTLVDLGAVPGLPTPTGGLTFALDDPNTLVIGGQANYPEGNLYSIAVIRDAEDHITGFSGTAAFYSNAPYNDGGVAFGPQNVLFLSRFPMNEMGQTMLGSTSTDKVVNLASMSVTESPGGLNFVPTGFPGAGELKLAGWGDGGWYTLDIAPDNTGTFNLVSATLVTNIPGGPEGFVYIPAGSPLFADYSSMLVSEWSAGNIVAYDLDANGNPVIPTRRVLVSGLEGAEGAAIDPLTGDFFFSTFTGGDDRVIAVHGFAPPPPDDPEEPGECSSPRPAGKGYWHRQCLGVSSIDGGLDPGRRERGPGRTTEPDFAVELMACADAKLQQLGFADTATCDGMDPDPHNDPCEKAMAVLTSLVLNVCADRVQTSCGVDMTGRGCDSNSVGDLLEESALLIHQQECHAAMVCGHGVNEGVAIDDGDSALEQHRRDRSPTSDPISGTRSGKLEGQMKR